MSSKPFAEFSWAHCVKPIMRRCSCTNCESFYCFEVIIDPLEKDKYPDGCNAERRIALCLFYDENETAPMDISCLKKKLHEDFKIPYDNIIDEYDFVGMLAVTASEFVNMDNLNAIDEEKIYDYDEHLNKPFFKVR